MEELIKAWSDFRETRKKMLSKIEASAKYKKFAKEKEEVLKEFEKLRKIKDSMEAATKAMAQNEKLSNLVKDSDALFNEVPDITIEACLNWLSNKK